MPKKCNLLITQLQTSIRHFDLHENNFEVVVTGELILRWTSKDRNDIYRYQTRGFESGDFAAFGIMIILKNPAFVPRMALGKKK